MPLRRIVSLVLFACCAILWGSEQVDPHQTATVFDRSAGDFLFFVWIAHALIFDRPLVVEIVELAQRAWPSVVAAFGFVGLWIISETINGNPDPSFLSLAGALRNLVYLLAGLAAGCLLQGKLRLLVPISYTSGILLAAAANLIHIAHDGSRTRVEDLPILYNPNVTGNMLCVAILLMAIVANHRYILTAVLLSGMAASLLPLTYSKGAWLMGVGALLATSAVTITKIFDVETLRYQKVVLGVSALLAAGIVSIEAPRIINIVETKLQTGDDPASNQFGFYVREGHIFVSLEMAMDRPFFGVGPKNWQDENWRRLYIIPNFAFLDNDNPHNGFAYILSTMGLPALAFFSWVLLRIVYLAALCLVQPALARVPVACGFALAFATSGLVMLQIFVLPFTWLILGMLEGMNAVRSRTQATRHA
jgi:O-antigen ligase